MLHRLLPRPLRMVISLTMALLLPGCGGISLSSFKPATLWIIALDITTSVPKDHFLIMRNDMAAYVILSRLRNREEVHMMPVDSNPENRVRVMQLSKPSGMANEIAAMAAHLQTFKRPDESHNESKRKQKPEAPLTTNIAGVLAYAKRNAQELAQERQRVAASGKPLPPAPLVIANLFTDGLPEGPQTPLPPGPWPAEVMVWFWGVEQEHAAALKTWATTKMGLPEAQVHIVRFTDWQTVADKIYGPQIGRPQPNLDILKRLASSKTIAQVAGTK